MTIDANIRVVRSVHGVEVYVQSADPVANFVLRFPPGTEITDGEAVQFVTATNNDDDEGKET